MEGQEWVLLVRRVPPRTFHRESNLLLRVCSTFNAFSRVDVRVDVKIPGGVVAYVIDLRGERYEATLEMWQETYLSALLRAMLYSDDPTYWLDAYRRLDPISTPEAELRFLQAAEALFLKGACVLCLSLFAFPIIAFLTLNLGCYRLASWLGSRDSGCDGSVKPSHSWRSQVLRGQRAVSTCGQPIREAYRTRAGGSITPSKELHWHECAFRPAFVILCIF